MSKKRMPIDDPQDGFFYPNVTLMVDFYNLYISFIDVFLLVLPSSSSPFVLVLQ